LKFTIRNLFLIVLFCGIFFLTLKPIADPDFWWHLRTGQLIAQTQKIPNADPFSFTANAKQWVAHEWLSDFFIFKSFNFGGYGLLFFIFSAVITASFLFAYLRCIKESKPYIAGFTLLLGAIASAPIWGVRPQMFSLLFTSFFLYLLDQYRLNGNFKTLIPIPMITILWVNLHAGYIIGIAIIIIYIFGYLLEAAILWFRKKEKIDVVTQKSLWILFSVLITSVLASLLNPTGFRILTYPFQTLTDSAMQSYINEWFSPDFHQMIWQPFAVMILALIGVGMIGNRPISITKILLTLVFGYGALRSIRNIPLFAIAAIPVIAEQFSYLIKFKPDEQKPSRYFRYIASIVISAIAVVLVLRFIQVTNKQQKSEAETFPKVAVDWIIENKPKGNLFNSYNWGGYMIWRLYPEYLVYIDGRADLYGEEFVSNYTEIYFTKSGWEEKLNQENIRIVFIESDSMLADALRQSSTWKKLFEDNISVIFLKIYSTSSYIVGRFVR
jgi:hypothetical protein